MLNNVFKARPIRATATIFSKLSGTFLFVACYGVYVAVTGSMYRSLREYRLACF